MLRNRRIIFRADDSTADTLERLAEQLGLSVSDTVWRLVLLVLDDLEDERQFLELARRLEGDRPLIEELTDRYQGFDFYRFVFPFPEEDELPEKPVMLWKPPPPPKRRRGRPPKKRNQEGNNVG